ncbi:unnamed protein product, partial [Didymodactylos carnosus]
MSLATSIEKLFKLQPTALSYEMDSSWLLIT